MRIERTTFGKVKQPTLTHLKRLTLSEGWMQAAAEADPKTPTFIVFDAFDKPLAWAILTTRYAGWVRGERALMLFVHERVRRAGYGKMLHKAAKEYLHKKNPNLLMIVFPHDRQAHSFFKAVKEIDSVFQSYLYSTSSTS